MVAEAWRNFVHCDQPQLTFMTPRGAMYTVGEAQMVLGDARTPRGQVADIRAGIEIWFSSEKAKEVRA